jgi:hypothetical protein
MVQGSTQHVGRPLALAAESQDEGRSRLEAVRLGFRQAALGQLLQCFLAAVGLSEAEG